MKTEVGRSYDVTRKDERTCGMDKIAYALSAQGCSPADFADALESVLIRFRNEDPEGVCFYSSMWIDPDGDEEFFIEEIDKLFHTYFKEDEFTSRDIPISHSTRCLIYSWEESGKVILRHWFYENNCCGRCPE